MMEYSELRTKILNDKEVISGNGLQNRAKLVERFIILLIKALALCTGRL